MEVLTMAELLVVRSKIKDFAKGMNVSGDFADGLSKKVEMLIADAVKRAEANGRKTVQSRDL
jgi:histone H3/H4